jgi:hypothetical protein
MQLLSGLMVAAISRLSSISTGQSTAVGLNR